MSEELDRLTRSHHILIHAFVLMSNHYHLLVSTHEDYPLSCVMQVLQKSISRKINREAKRINHVFGGPYKASLIVNADYYAKVFRYLAQNPLRAKMCRRTEDYPFSTFSNDRIPVCSPVSGIAELVPPKNISEWINTFDSPRDSLSIRKGLMKTIFKPVTLRI